MHRGVYAVGHRVLRAEGHRLAAVLACGPGAVLSHRSAAAHWGLLGTDQERVDVTAPATRHGIPGIRLHRSRSLDARDTTSHEGIPITTIARTLLDLAATARSRAARAGARAGDVPARLRPPRDHRRHRAMPTGTAARRSSHARPPSSPGSPAASGRTACSGSSEAPVSRCQSATSRSTPPITAPARPTSTGQGTTSSSRPTAGTATARAPRSRSDRAKDAALTAAGYRVVRFTWLTDDATILRRLRALLAQPRGLAR